jgi:hypothetical protein
MQTEYYWFGLHMGPSWALKRPEGPKISKIILKIGNVRIHLLLINNILSVLSFKWYGIDI